MALVKHKKSKTKAQYDVLTTAEKEDVIFFLEGETDTSGMTLDQEKTTDINTRIVFNDKDYTGVKRVEPSDTVNGQIVVDGTPLTVYIHPTTTAVSAAAVKVGKDNKGHVILGDTIGFGDVGAAPATHSHGNIQSSGTLQTNDITIANNDRLVVTDASDSNKIARSSVAFDGSTTSKYLSPKGTWEDMPTGWAPINNPEFTGVPKAPTAPAGTDNTQIATTAFVKNEIDAVLQASDAMRFKGTIGAAAQSPTVTSLPASHSVGDTYKVVTAGSYAGVSCEIGDMLICLTDGTTANNAHWTVVQGNLDGTVTGPVNATNGSIVLFDGTTGKVVKDSQVVLPSDPKFTDTWRPLSINGTEIQSSASANFINGNGISITEGSPNNGSITISANPKSDGVTGATANRYGTCSTAAATAAKTVSITAGTPTLEAGLRVTVKFSSANTAGTPTLNVNSLGAKDIYFKGTKITTGDEKGLLKGVCDFVYDGTQWHLLGADTDTNTWRPIKVNSTEIQSSTAVNLIAGTNVTITEGAGNDGNGGIRISATDTDTKNTTGGDDTSNKIFLVGMTSQTSGNGNARTYTHDTAYVGTDGCLYSGGTKVLTSVPVVNTTENGLMTPEMLDALTWG